MFWPDVVELKEFYASKTGRIASQLLKRRLRDFWASAKGEHILGMGFATPYLANCLNEADLVVACMPAMQGVVHWPATQDNLTLLTSDTELPFPDNSMNRVLVIHALEHSEHTRVMLQELWRVLTPSGRLLAVVPNRRGIWARSPHSPFAHGYPFTGWQLRQLLCEHFAMIRADSALFVPPTKSDLLHRVSGLLEEVGRRFFPMFGGVLLMEVEKRIYAAKGEKRQREQPRPVYVKAPTPAMTFK